MVSLQDMHHTCHNVEIFQERGWADGHAGEGWGVTGWLLSVQGEVEGRGIGISAD